MELLLGLIFATSWVLVAPKVIADAVTTMRASKAGAWDTIDKQRERADKKAASRRAAISKAWAATRAARNKKAGGDGKYRPGAKAYLGDLYHGFWEDKLEKRTAKRAARPPYEYDPNKPKLRDRIDARVAGKVQVLREQSGRFGRALINPVGEGRPVGGSVRPTAPIQRIPDEVTPEVADVVDTTGTMCGMCTVVPAERYIPPIGQEQPLPACIGCYNGVLDARWASTQKQQTTGLELDPEPEWLTPDLDEQLYNVTCSRCNRGYVLEIHGDGNERCGNCGWRFPPPAQMPADVTDNPSPNPQEHNSVPPTARVDTRLEAAVNQLPNTSNQGDTMTTATATEVNTNEDARMAFAAMATAAAEAADAIAMLEAAKAKMAAAANGTADGMSGKRFDSLATQAAGEAAEAINIGTLADWSEKIDTVLSAAERGLRALDKYLDAEDTVTSNNIDTSTLAPAN